ncbi:MAG: hypothetical protein ILP19_09300 [Oscillospiraceae bacterium]|nr:hypothetical protein [Oscillospiraceae bacterium]
MSELSNLRVYKQNYMTVYRVSFRSMGELYMYLKSEPPVNNYVFQKMSSISTDVSFGGVSYDWALEYCLGGYHGEYSVLLDMQKDLERYVPIKQYSYLWEHSFAGSHPNVPAFVADSPKAMYRRRRSDEKKFCTVYFNLACPVKTKTKEILHRGALTLSLVKLLEAEGMGVDLRVFMCVYDHDEMFLFEISLKSPQEKLNAKKAFYPLCSREFLRRIVIRVMESVPLRNRSWFPNYGMAVGAEQFRNMFGIPERDFVISTPGEMGITGGSIYRDGAEMFEKMGLDENIVIRLRKAGESD